MAMASLLLLLPLSVLISSSAIAGPLQAAADPCASNLTVSNLIPFNTSSLSCLSALSSARFVLRYGNAGPDLWSYVLSAPDPGSYIAVGFSADGNMVGSSAVAGWIVAGKGRGLAKQYRLAKKESSGCPPDEGSLRLVHGRTLVVSDSSSGALHLAFQLVVDRPPPYLIFAVGPDGRPPSLSNYFLPFHRDDDTIAVNYTVGAPRAVSSDDGEESAAASMFPPERRHALLVMTGWGVLVPVGILLPRYFKKYDPMWFYAHISVQMAGFALGLAGIVIGFGLDDEGIANVGVHETLGVVVLVGGCLQVTALLARPDKKAKVRKYWNWFHHYVGRASVACAMANIFLGLAVAQETNSWDIAYSAFLAVWLLVSVALEIIRCIADKRE